MAARLFSKDPLSWGQILFLWVGGLSALAVPVIGARLMYDEGDIALSSAYRSEQRAESLAGGVREAEANLFVRGHMEAARAEYRTARRWFGGTIALLLITAGGLAFLVWRSFHGTGQSQLNQ